MFGPWPWRCEAPDVTVGAGTCGAEVAAGLEAVEWVVPTLGVWGCVDATELAVPPKDVAAAAVAVLAATRMITIRAALAGTDFENICFSLKAQMASRTTRLNRRSAPYQSLMLNASDDRSQARKHVD